MTAITADQIEDLFHGHITRIDRGDEYDVITRDDVLALIDTGDLDLEDDGTPTTESWEILADALSGDTTDGPRDRALTAVEDASRALAEAEQERDEAIRTAVKAGVSVISIANAAGLSRARIYQIRDGRR